MCTNNRFSIPITASLLSPLLISLLLFSSVRAQQKNPVDILEADSLVGGSVNGERVQKILGNVRLQSGDILMRCDSAYQFVNQNEFRAFGDIEINTGEENIWADTLVYFTDIDFSQLRGRVIIEADTTTLFGHSVDYRFSTKVAHFIDHVRLEDQQGVLIANSGFYYREADSAMFYGQVQLADSLQYLEGDSLLTNRKSEYYEVHGDIFADDRENETMLKGTYLEADSTGRRVLQGNAWLKNYGSNKQDTTATDTTQIIPSAPPDSLRQDTLRQSGIPSDSLADVLSDTALTARTENREQAEADTTHIRAKEILSLRQKTATDTSTITYAYGDVRIWSRKFSAISDSARYESSTETFELWSDPVAWHDAVQLTGPYIKVLLREGEIEQLSSYPNPFSVQQDTTIGRLNQIKGDTLTAFFTEGSLDRIHVVGNSHLLRFTKDEAEKPDGAIEMTAPVTHIMFDNGELDSLIATGAINGSYLPESDQTTNRRLDGFAWNPEQRPQRPEQKMEPRFPPIPDERPFTLPRRYREYIEKVEGSEQ